MSVQQPESSVVQWIVTAVDRPETSKSVIARLAREAWEEAALTNERGDRLAFSAVRCVRAPAAQKSEPMPAAPQKVREDRMDIGKLIATEDRTQVERWIRSQSRQCYIGNGVVLCQILGKLPCYVFGQDRALAPHLMLDGFWEMWITQAVARYVKPGMTCVDVGACFGYYTLLFGDLVGAKGKVVAFEARQETARLLSDSVKLNGLDHVTVENVGIGVEGAKGTFEMEPNHWSDSFFQFEPNPDATHTSFSERVTLRSLDELYGSKTWEKGPVHLIKVDAEGSELLIWRGMQRLLTEQNPLILLEFNRLALERYAPGSATALVEEIQKAGYRLRKVADTGLPVDLAGAPEQVEMLYLQR